MIAGGAITGDDTIFYVKRALARRTNTPMSYQKPHSPKNNSSMNTPECGRWLSDPILAQEAAKRGAHRYMRLREGGYAQANQEFLDQLGRTFREARQEQELTQSEVARELQNQGINIHPAKLCFLESGWATEAEYLVIFDAWVYIIGIGEDTAENAQHIREHKQRLESIISKELE